MFFVSELLLFLQLLGCYDLFHLVNLGWSLHVFCWLVLFLFSVGNGSAWYRLYRLISSATKLYHLTLRRQTY